MLRTITLGSCVSVQGIFERHGARAAGHVGNDDVPAHGLVERGSQRARMMPPRRLGQVLAGFVQAGGKILMCPHCSAACGAPPDSLVPGARHAEEGGLAKLVFEADKVVDY